MVITIEEYQYVTYVTNMIVDIDHRGIPSHLFHNIPVVYP